jgi:hypothetical protein
MGYCSGTVLQHILLYSTTKEQWDKLKEAYQPLGIKQLGAKLRAFTGYEVQKESTLQSINTDLNTLQAEIGDINPNKRPSNQVKLAIFYRALRALEKQWDPMIT